MRNQNLLKGIFSLCFILLFGVAFAKPIEAKTMNLQVTDCSVRVNIKEKRGEKSKYKMEIYQDNRQVVSSSFQGYGYSDTHKIIFDLNPATSYRVVVQDKTNKETKSWNVQTKTSDTYPVFASRKKAGQYVYRQMTNFKPAQFYLSVSSSDYEGKVLGDRALMPYDYGKFKSAKKGYYSEALTYHYQTIGRKLINGKKYLLIDSEYHFIVGTKKEQAVEKKADAFVKTLKDKSKKQKLWKVYKYVAKRARYSSKASLRGTAYGALVKRKANCGGYAEAFALLCEKAGIECILEAGTVNGKGHGWAMVKYGGKWRMCDVTFGDTGGNLKSYFLVKKSSKKYRSRKK